MTMKTKNLILAVLVVAGATFSASSAKAQGTYSQGDLLLGFRDTSDSKDYVIDLGSASAFTGQSLGFTETLSLGNVNADLTNIFGAGWSSDANLYWGVAGSTSSSILYAGESEQTLGTIGTPWSEASTHTQGTPAGLINGIGTNAVSFSTVSSNATDAFIQNNSDPASWESYMPFGANSNNSDSVFKYYAPEFEGNSSTGISNTALDLFQMNPANGTGNLGTYQGTFTIDNGANVTFTVVPEPSTYAAVVLGAGILVLVSRRRRIAA